MALLPVRRSHGETNDLARLHRDMDDPFRGFFDGWDWLSRGISRWPTLDIAENDNEYIIKAEVPGCKADDIDISVHNNTLVISGEKKHENKNEGKGLFHIERSFGSFHREVGLASDVDPGKIHASCENGVLTVNLPKSEKTKPIRIKIQGQ